MKRRLGRFEIIALSIWFGTYTALVVAFDTPAPEHVDFETDAFYVSDGIDSNLAVQSLVESARGSLQLEELGTSGVPSLEELTANDPRSDEEFRHDAGEQATSKEEFQSEVKNLSEDLPAGPPPPPALASPNNVRVQ